MYRRCLIAVFFVTLLVGCTAPTPEETAQEPKWSTDGMEIKFQMITVPTDPIIGTWKLNVEKSKFPPWEPGPKEETVVYREVDPDKIEVTQTSIQEDGSSNLLKCTFPAQGGVWECEDPPQGLSMYQIFAAPGEWYGLYIDDNGIQTALRHKVISKDGKTQHQTMKSPDYNGRPYESVMILDKQ